MIRCDRPSASRLFAHAFRELRRSCDELSAGIAGLGTAFLTLERAPESAPPSFFFLKKQALQLAVQSHKCLRLLARLRGQEAPALQTALTARLAEIAHILPNDVENVENVEYPDEGPLVLPLRDSAGKPAGLVVQPAALRLFLRENHLMPSLNHVLQQTEGASAHALPALDKRIQEMIRTAPMPEALAEALSRAVQSGGSGTSELSGLSPETSLRLLPLIRAKDGCDLPLPRLAPRRADQLEQGFREAVVRLFGPETLAILRMRGLCHERLDFTLRCLPAADVALLNPEPAEPAEEASAHPVDPANSPAAWALRRLCLLAGAIPNTAGPDAPPTLQALALRCREAGLRACFQNAFQQGEVHLGPGFVAARYCLNLEHDADEIAGASLPAAVLAAASDALTKNAVPPPPDAPGHKNAVLLDWKYCTVALSSPALLLEAWSPERGPAFCLMSTLSGPAQPLYAFRNCRDLQDLTCHVRAMIASALRQPVPFPPPQPG